MQFHRNKQFSLCFFFLYAANNIGIFSRASYVFGFMVFVYSQLKSDFELSTYRICKLPYLRFVFFCVFSILTMYAALFLLCFLQMAMTRSYDHYLLSFRNLPIFRFPIFSFTNIRVCLRLRSSPDHRKVNF